MSHPIVQTSGGYSGVEKTPVCNDTAHDILKYNADLEQYVRERCPIKKITLRRKVGKCNVVENVHYDGEKAHREEVMECHEMLKDRFFLRGANGKLGGEEFEMVSKEEADEAYDADEEDERAIKVSEAANMTKSVRFAK